MHYQPALLLTALAALSTAIPANNKRSTPTTITISIPTSTITTTNSKIAGTSFPIINPSPIPTATSLPPLGPGPISPLENTYIILKDDLSHLNFTLGITDNSVRLPAAYDDARSALTNFEAAAGEDHPHTCPEDEQVLPVGDAEEAQKNVGIVEGQVERLYEKVRNGEGVLEEFCRIEKVFAVVGDFVEGTT